MRWLAILALLWSGVASAQYLPLKVNNVGGGDYTVYTDNNTNHLYLNSSEIGASRHTTLDSDIVFADDFEDGSWYEADCSDRSSALAVDGWCGNIFNNGPNPANAVITPGVAGSLVAGNYGSMASTSCGSGCSSNMADHELGPTAGNQYNELWVRFYWKFAPGFVLQGNTKLLTFTTNVAGFGGFDVGSWGTGTGPRDQLPMGSYYDCNILDYWNPQNDTVNTCYLRQNQGNNFVFDDHGGNWIFVEIHIKLETTAGTTQDGVWEMWADDCGSDGLSCPSTPTLRASFNNIRWKAPGNNDGIQSVWFEGQRDYSSGSSFDGTNLSYGDYIYVDQIMVKSANGPIGPVELPN